MIGDIRKFRFWCQKVLPLVYDDSLSYYEVLCKIVQYLNKVIEDVNSIPEYIDAVIDEKLSDEHLQELIEHFVLNIENAISSNNEEDNTNSSADYNIGQMLWWNGKLYRVIRQIDAGDTFIVDTNIALVNFEDLFNDFMDEVKHDITANDDGGSPTATQNWTAGTWLWLNDVLYLVKSDITLGNAYVFSGANANVEQITVENEFKKEATARANADSALQDAIDDETQARQNADTTLGGRIDGEVQARQDADGALSDRIDNEVQARQDADGDLNDLTTSDKTNLVNAINETLGTIGSITGNLSDLVTENKTNLVNAINEVASKTSVILNVKDYGAIGDGVTNDYAAINAAIAAANTNGLTTIYFPDGKYFCGDGSFVIDTSHIQFVGAANSELVSNGLSDGAFINFTSTYTLEQYNYARVPLKDICITGNYFTDTTAFGVIGVKMGTDSTFISPHCILVNVTIRNFAIGLQLSSAYKSSYLNCTFLANNRGVDVPSAGIQQAVPCEFVTCWWEMNNYGIFALATGYNSISIFGGAFEYNRSIFTGYTKMVYIGTRFEFDARASCDASLNARSVYNQASTPNGVSVSKFIGCFFLELNNYLDNVTYWIPNPYMLTSYNTSRIYGLGGNPVTLEFILCEFEGVNSISGYYYIGCDHFYGAGNYSKTIGAANMINPAQVVTSANGFINN